MAVNKFDNSMLDAGTIGTTANKLLQLDGSTKIPAVDGSLLTNIPSSFTKSASDPTISTNPSGGVGSLWANTTSGEVYCCTDATAGKNTWTNIGAGTGDVEPSPHYQGETYGFCSAGGDPHTNAVEKFSFTTDGNAVDHCDLFVVMTQCAGNSSATHGYTQGGESNVYPGEHNNVVQKFAFASTANGTDVGNLSVSRDKLSGSSSTTHGYAQGGDDDSSCNIIDRTSFASDGDSADVGDLTSARKWVAGCSYTTHGYAMGGQTTVDIIDKISFATATANSTDVGNLSSGRGYASGQSSETHGYQSGGYNDSNVVDKWSFTTDGNATDVGNLTSGRNRVSGSSSTAYGYCMAGNPTVNIIDKTSFAADGDSSDVGDLITGRYGSVGQQI